MIEYLMHHLSTPSLTEGAVLYIFLALAIGFLVGRIHRAGRIRAFQNRSEALVSRITHKHFGPPDYHLLSHVTLPTKNGTTQIDHILVSRFGVFVMETKDYKGWIFGNENHSMWTQVLFRVKFRFQNPLFQNRGHVRAVRDILDFLPSKAVKSLVIFAGEAEFKTEVPAGVIHVDELVDYLRRQDVELLSRNRVQFSVGRLETARLAISGKTDLEHVRRLREKYGGFS